MLLIDITCVIVGFIAGGLILAVSLDCEFSGTFFGGCIVILVVAFLALSFLGMILPAFVWILAIITVSLISFIIGVCEADDKRAGEIGIVSSIIAALLFIAIGLYLYWNVVTSSIWTVAGLVAGVVFLGIVFFAGIVIFLEQANLPRLAAQDGISSSTSRTVEDVGSRTEMVEESKIEVIRWYEEDTDPYAFLTESTEIENLPEKTIYPLSYTDVDRDLVEMNWRKHGNGYKGVFEHKGKYYTGLLKRRGFGQFELYIKNPPNIIKKGSYGEHDVCFTYAFDNYYHIHFKEGADSHPVSLINVVQSYLKSIGRDLT